MSGQNIDSKVVELAFQNGQFESGVKNSLASIKALKNGLNFDDAVRSMSSLTKAGKNFDLSSIGEGVQQISSKFTAFGLLGVAIMMNIANAAVAAGKKILDAFYLDPIKLGFNEYELKMGAIQTIMAGTGESLQTVNGYLNDLNDYSDKTIYSFADMTQSIGKFTNAGVKLDLAVSSIKGIANVAALSGANANEAARAMYNFSQALSQGSVRLIDWKSIELANMGTAGFKEQIIGTALAMGTLTKAADGTLRTLKGTEVNAKNFQYTLDDLWFTSEVLTTTLTKYTDETTALGKAATAAAQDVKTFSQMISTLKESAQSGWAQTFELILGDFTEGKKLWTELNGIFGGILSSSTKARNDVIQGWSDLGGRARIVDSLRNTFSALASVVEPIAAALKQFFPPLLAEQLYSVSAALTLFTSNLKLNHNQQSVLGRVAKGVFAILDIGRMFVEALAKAFMRIVKAIVPTAGGFMDILAIVGDLAVKLRNLIRNTDFFNEAFLKIGNVLGIVIGVVVAFFNSFVEGFNTLKESIANNGIFGAIALGFQNFIASLGTAISSIKNLDMTAITDFIDLMKIRFAPLLNVLGAIAAFVGKVFGSIFGVISGLIDKFAPIVKTVAKTILGIMTSIGTSIATAISKIDLSNINFNGVFDGLNTGLLAGLFLLVNNFLKKGSGPISQIEGLFKSVTGFTDSAAGFMGKVSVVLDGVRTSLEAWQASIRADILLKIAGAIAILAISLIALSMVDSVKLTMAIAAITTMFIDLFGAMAVYQKATTGPDGGVSSMAKAVIGMIGIALALLLMAGVVTKLAKLDPEELAAGIAGIGALILMAIGTSKLLSNDSGAMVTGALNLIGFSLAITLLIIPLKQLAKLDWDEMARGLVGIGTLLGALALFLKFANVDKASGFKALGIVILAGAILAMSYAVSKFADMDKEKMIIGLETIGIILAGLAAFTQLVKNDGGILLTAIAIGVLGGAMLIFSFAIEKLGAMDMETINKGLLAMGGALALIAVGMTAMPPNMLINAAALVVVSGALLILSFALGKMGSMSWESIGKGLTILGGSMLILAIGLNVMTTALPGAAAMLVAAGAILILVPALMLLGSMSWESIGKGLAAIAGMFTILGLAGLVLTPVVPTLLLLAGAMLLLGVAALAVGVGVTAFATGLATMALLGSTGIAAITLVIMGLVTLLPTIATAMAQAFITFLETIAKAGPAIYEAGRSIMLTFISAITNVIPDVVAMISTFILTMLDALTLNLPAFIEKGYEIITAFLTGFNANIGQLIQLGMDILTNIMTGIALKLPALALAAFNLMISFIDSLSFAISENSQRLIDASVGLAQSVLTALGQGIITYGYLAIEPMLAAVEAIVEVIRGKVSDFITAGKNLVRGFARGIKDAIVSAVRAAKELANAVVDAVKDVLKIKSPSKVTREQGMFVAKGLAMGITKYADLASKAASEMGNRAVTGLSKAISSMSGIVSGDINMDPVIRPVLDLSEINKGSKNINSFFGNKTIDLTASTSRAASIATGMNLQNGGLDSKTVLPVPASNISMVQNNFSPKELSRLEIYRQTRNQINTLKGLVGAP